MTKVNLKFISRRARSLSPASNLRRKSSLPIKIKFWEILTGSYKQQKSNLPVSVTNLVGKRTVKWVSSACESLANKPDLLSELPQAAQTGRLILHLTEEEGVTGDVNTVGRWKLGLCDGKLTYLSYQHQDPIHNSLIIYANDEHMIQILTGRIDLQTADALGIAKITGNCQIRNTFPALIKILNREIPKSSPSLII
ncbi:Oidioi.mRNA.OKI2018_I69.chr2.g4049.t1.cds [Oikopleura dioica]|uniref:Oidioi.mRNA.OKI2018_I69.chr2.g4049.t1.cds n=1 Tax=Oikopleura dioica TaxID=34765 RepID=A0ABN7SVY3_OIKDI|nr:Oidioi.mRNA.OKI2018_I69.chr2.g4049.t1.cds [Oikopleura dioica]